MSLHVQSPVSLKKRGTVLLWYSSEILYLVLSYIIGTPVFFSAGALYYLLKGVLPMLTEFYRCQSEENQPLQGEYLQITHDICRSLWVCEVQLFLILTAFIMQLALSRYSSYN